MIFAWLIIAALAMAPNIVMHGEMQRGSVIGLDYVRFAAAALVALFHLGYWVWAPFDSTARQLAGDGFLFPSLARYVSSGWVGVEIFFVLSGFVISYSANGRSAAAFLKSRALRLIPAAWICATISLVLILLVVPEASAGIASEWLRACLFWPLGPWIDGVYWTLAIEISFYSLIFLLLCCDRIRWLFRLAVALTLMSTGYWLASIMGWLPSELQAFGVSRWGELLLIRHGSSFALGVLLWWSTTRTITIFTAGAMMLAVLGSVLEIEWSAHERARHIPDASPDPATAIFIWLTAVLGIILSIRYNRDEEGGSTSARLARKVGLATYPLYLLHTTLGAISMRLLFAAGVSPVSCLVISLLIVAIAALLVSELERLLRRGIAPSIGVAIDGMAMRFPIFRRQTAML